MVFLETASRCKASLSIFQIFPTADFPYVCHPVVVFPSNKEIQFLSSMALSLVLDVIVCLEEVQAQNANTKTTQNNLFMIYFFSDKTYFTIALASSSDIDGCGVMGIVPQLPAPPFMIF